MHACTHAHTDTHTCKACRAHCTVTDGADSSLNVEEGSASWEVVTLVRGEQAQQGVEIAAAQVSPSFSSHPFPLSAHACLCPHSPRSRVDRQSSQVLPGRLSGTLLPVHAQIWFEGCWESGVSGAGGMVRRVCGRAGDRASLFAARQLHPAGLSSPPHSSLPPSLSPLPLFSSLSSLPTSPRPFPGAVCRAERVVVSGSAGGAGGGAGRCRAPGLHRQPPRQAHTHPPTPDPSHACSPRRVWSSRECVRS
eukprot:1320233-Rhodomonas_salina.2